MNASGERFPDHRGWLRNRRAVVVDEAGLTIERWVGAPTHVAWRQITRARWLGSEGLEVVTPRQTLRFGRSVAGLDRLAQLLESGLNSGPDAAEPLAVSRADILAQLGGQTSFTVLTPDARWVADLARLARDLALPLALLPLWLFAQLWIVRPMLALAFGLAVGAAVWSFKGLWRKIVRRRSGTLTVHADGVRSVFAEGTLSFTWAEVRSVTWEPTYTTVHLTDQTYVVIPAFGDLGLLFSALRLVGSARRRMPNLKQPVSPAALSRIGPELADADRGLSRAEEVDA